MMSSNMFAPVIYCMSKKQSQAAEGPGSLRPIPVPSKLWSQVGMDLIGPLPQTSRGNQYIVTLTDYFTKWAEAAPLPDKFAVEVARFIYSSNGLTEWFNQTLSRFLAKIMEESHSDWDMKIDTVLLGYRASRQRSTKFSPYFMLF